MVRNELLSQITSVLHIIKNNELFKVVIKLTLIHFNSLSKDFVELLLCSGVDCYNGSLDTSVFRTYKAEHEKMTLLTWQSWFNSDHSSWTKVQPWFQLVQLLSVVIPLI